MLYFCRLFFWERERTNIKLEGKGHWGMWILEGCIWSPALPLSFFLFPLLHEMKSFMPNMVLPSWYSSSPWPQSLQTQELGTETMWPNKSPLLHIVYRQVFCHHDEKIVSPWTGQLPCVRHSLVWGHTEGQPQPLALGTCWGKETEGLRASPPTWAGAADLFHMGNCSSWRIEDQEIHMDIKRQRLQGLSSRLPIVIREKGTEGPVQLWSTHA